MTPKVLPLSELVALVLILDQHPIGGILLCTFGVVCSLGIYAWRRSPKRE